MPTAFQVKLEPDLAPLLNAWRKEPTPQSTGALIKALKPTLDRGVSMFGRNAGPSAASEAKTLAISALKSYDPTKSSLATHVTNHLKRLQRYTQNNRLVRMPEKLNADSAYLNNLEAEFLDQEGRNPTAQELADSSGISMSRIAKARMLRSPVSEGQYATEENNYSELSGMSKPDSSRYLDLVYQGLSPVDQFILESSAGLNGSRVLSAQEIAKQLRLSPGAISQRRAKIQQQIDFMTNSQLL